MEEKVARRKWKNALMFDCADFNSGSCAKKKMEGRKKRKKEKDHLQETKRRSRNRLAKCLRRDPRGLFVGPFL
jgi:hypothetical protein